MLQYNDPFVPPWKRRNEVVLAVAARAAVAAGAEPASVPAETDADASNADASNALTAPPARLQLPLAKLGAVAANKRQWGIGVQVPRAKLDAREVNRQQWGIGEAPARQDRSEAAQVREDRDVTQKSIAALENVEFDALERLLLMDLDGNGEVDVKEFKAALCGTGLSEGEARDMFDQVDLDGSGSISFAEFVQAVKREVTLKKSSDADFEARLLEIRTTRSATLTKKLMGPD